MLYILLFILQEESGVEIMELPNSQAALCISQDSVLVQCFFFFFFYPLVTYVCFKAVTKIKINANQPSQRVCLRFGRNLRGHLVWLLYYFREGDRTAWPYVQFTSSGLQGQLVAERNLECLCPLSQPSAFFIIEMLKNRHRKPWSSQIWIDGDFLWKSLFLHQIWSAPLLYILN